MKQETKHHIKVWFNHTSNCAYEYLTMIDKLADGFTTVCKDTDREGIKDFIVALCNKNNNHYEKYQRTLLFNRKK